MRELPAAFAVLFVGSGTGVVCGYVTRVRPSLLGIGQAALDAAAGHA